MGEAVDMSRLRIIFNKVSVVLLTKYTGYDNLGMLNIATFQIQ